MFYNKLKYTVILLLLLINILSATDLEKTSLQLKWNFTKEELNFIAHNKDIKIAMTGNFVPFIFMKENKYQGFNIDILEKISKISGLNFNIETASWANSLRKFKEHKVDMISSISHTKQRELFTLYSKPYYVIPTYIFGKKDDTQYKNINNLKGKKIGIVKNMFYKNKLKALGIEVIEYENNNEKAKALAFGKVDYFLSNFISGTQAIISQSLTNIEPLDEFTDIKKEDLRFGINKNKPILHSIIQKSLNKITYKEYENLKHKWIINFKQFKKKRLNFTEKELKYLQHKKVIKMCIDPNWMPLEKIENGKTIGFTSDFMKLISQKIQTPINLIQTSTWSESLKNMEDRLCDIIPMVATTPKLKKNMDFTSPYLSLQVVLATETSTIYINSLENKLDKTFAVVKNYALYEYLKYKYPTLKILSVNSLHDGLQKVTNGEVFGYIDNAAVITHEIQKNFFSTIAITGKIDLKMHYSIGTRNDEKLLNSILNKASLSVSNSETQDIKNRWFKFRQDRMINYELIRNIIIIFLILSIIGTAFLLILKKKNQKLKIAQEKIKEFNLKLKKEVEHEVEKNKEQQLLMFSQSRLAQMGEIINMIAHQWRQPLSTINAIVFVIDMKISKLTIEKKHCLEKEFNDLEALTAHMSKTIDDFRNFFKPEKEKIKFNLKTIIENSIALIRPVLDYEEIIIHTNYQNNIELLGYPNEFGQVVVNILNNAKDALLSDTENKKKEIHIQLSQKEKTISLSIKDNAKGINEKNLPNIFDPYFSTKSEKNGTGLGLYISKMIIEEHMSGTLDVKNTSTGAKFTIEFHLP